MVVLIDLHHTKLVIVHIRERGDRPERDDGVERPSNTLPKFSSVALRSVGVLLADRLSRLTWPWDLPSRAMINYLFISLWNRNLTVNQLNMMKVP